MNRLICILALFSIFLFGCHKDADDNVTQASIIFNFSHHWDGIPIKSSDFNDLKFINANGETLSIERLRYLISKFTFTNTNDADFISEEYHLFDVSEEETLSLTLSLSIPTDNYNNASFVFGFTNEMNIDGIYQDLNSESFNVPAMLGGGYHYMQFDGKFINSSDSEQGFNYHAIRAVDNLGDNPIFPQDTFIVVDLGPIDITANTIINIKMNVAEWFKTPNTWDLNQLNQMLMPNSTAQIMMYENGQNVFTLESVEN